jgi:hypothetical protein
MYQTEDGFGTYFANVDLALDIPATEDTQFVINFTFGGSTYTNEALNFSAGQQNVVGQVLATSGSGTGVSGACINGCYKIIGFVIVGPGNVNISAFQC